MRRSLPLPALVAGFLLALLAPLLTLPAQAGVLPAASPAPAAAASPAASAPVAARASGRRAFKCGRWRKSAHGSVGWRYCANITKVSGRFKTDYTETQYNKFRKQSVRFTCSSAKSTTWTFGGSATVEAEAGVIFAKAKTSITANMSRSTTTTDTTSASYKIRPRSWAHCKRGTYVYSWRGVVKKQLCGSSGCRWSRKTYSKHAPTRAAWFIGPGRG